LKYRSLQYGLPVMHHLIPDFYIINVDERTAGQAGREYIRYSRRKACCCPQAAAPALAGQPRCPSLTNLVCLRRQALPRKDDLGLADHKSLQWNPIFPEGAWPPGKVQSRSVNHFRHAQRMWQENTPAGVTSMSKLIYQIFVGKNNIAANLAWKALSEEDTKSLQAKERASRAAVGVKGIVYCDSAWADEEHPWWGIMQFPDLKARIDHTHALQEMGWLEITDAFSLLGTPQIDLAEVTIPDPIYKLWILKNNPATALTSRLPKGLDALMWEKHNALYKECASQVILYCDSTWCNEAYLGFGISVYPNIEANMTIMQGLNELGWPGYMESITYLGIPIAGALDLDEPDAQSNE
jgi:hypothetical protein